MAIHKNKEAVNAPVVSTVNRAGGDFFIREVCISQYLLKREVLECLVPLIAWNAFRYAVV
jgi:hypothetical protein